MNEMKLLFFNKKFLIALAILIQFSFFISAIWTGWYDYFFFGSSLHYCCQGLDFYSIPNAAFAFFHQGDLTGNLPVGIQPYSIDIFTNSNVYHPLFTIMLGSFFLLFKAKFAFYLWMGIKLIINLGLAYYLYQTFKTNRFIGLAIFIFLANFSQYNDIKISQYQYLTNIFLFLLLIELAKKGSQFRIGFFYFLTLLVKPIGLLWAPVLLIKKQYIPLISGLTLFILSTIPFLITGSGNYYLYNLLSHLTNPILTNTIDIMSLNALLRYIFKTSPDFLSVLKFLFLGIVTLLAFYKTVDLTKIIYLLILYFLFFYDLVYQYHYSILIPVFTICLLTCKDFQNRFARILLFIISLPHIFFILRFFQIGFKDDPFLGPNPTWFGWTLVNIFQITPLILLAIIVFRADIITIIQDLKKRAQIFLKFLRLN